MRIHFKNTALISVVSVALFFSSPSFSASYECPKAAPEAYQGDLQVSSKYDSTDPTRSTEVPVDRHSLIIQKQLNQFSAGIVYFSDYYARYREDRRGELALNCLHNWVSHWASQSALTTDNSTFTGKALRSWTLSSISSSLLKVSHLTNGQWKLAAEESQWLNQLAQLVKEDFSGRIGGETTRINNHDYWAAWSVMATARLTKDRDLADWAYVIFKHAITQAVYDAQTNTAYLPNEIKRGSLGVHYTHFALTPLVMLAEHLPQLGYSINYQDEQTLSNLTSFGSLTILRPQELAHLTDFLQKKPSTGILSWSIPYRYRNPNHTPTIELQQTYANQIKGYDKIGGNIEVIYPTPNF